MTRAVCFIVAFAGITTAVFADIPPTRERDQSPPPVAPKTVPVAVRYDADAEYARLEIPTQVLRSAGRNAGTNGRTSSLSPGRTIGAGLALSAAVASMVLVRRKTRVARGVAAAIVIGGLCTAGGLALANQSPPRFEDLAPPAESPTGFTALNLPGEVVLTVVPRGDSITLVLPGEEPATAATTIRP